MTSRVLTARLTTPADKLPSRTCAEVPELLGEMERIRAVLSRRLAMRITGGRRPGQPPVITVRRRLGVSRAGLRNAAGILREGRFDQHARDRPLDREPGGGGPLTASDRAVAGSGAEAGRVYRNVSGAKQLPPCLGVGSQHENPRDRPRTLMLLALTRPALAQQCCSSGRPPLRRSGCGSSFRTRPSATRVPVLRPAAPGGRPRVRRGRHLWARVRRRDESITSYTSPAGDVWQ